MVKRAIGGLKVFYVHPQSGSITEVTVESAGKAGKPYYEARLLVRPPSGGLWEFSQRVRSGSGRMLKPLRLESRKENDESQDVPGTEAATSQHAAVVSLCGQVAYVASSDSTEVKLSMLRPVPAFLQGPFAIADWTPHKLGSYRLWRKSIKPFCSRHGFRGFPSLISQVANALAFISRSTWAYRLVVSNETCPSHARMVLISTPARRRWTAVVCRIV